MDAMKIAIERITVSEVRSRELTNLDEAARLSGLAADRVILFCEHRLIFPCGEDDAGTVYFDAGAVMRLRYVGRLLEEEETGVGECGAGIILHLLGRLEEMERELRVLRLGR